MGREWLPVGSCLPGLLVLSYTHAKRIDEKERKGHECEHALVLTAR